MTHDEASILVRKHVDDLSEFFDNVQILASSKPDGESKLSTQFHMHGSGDIFARIELADTFVDLERSVVRGMIADDMYDMDDMEDSQ